MGKLKNKPLVNILMIWLITLKTIHAGEIQKRIYSCFRVVCYVWIRGVKQELASCLETQIELSCWVKN